MMAGAWRGGPGGALGQGGGFSPGKGFFRKSNGDAETKTQTKASAPCAHYGLVGGAPTRESRG